MFNTLLKELRAKNGMTQGQLAKAAGVSPGNVGDWESGKSKPGYNALASLARISMCPPTICSSCHPKKERAADGAP